MAPSYGSRPPDSLHPRPAVKRRRFPQSPSRSSMRSPLSPLSQQAHDHHPDLPPPSPPVSTHERHGSPPPSHESRSRSRSRSRTRPLADSSSRDSAITSLAWWRERLLDRLPRLEELPTDYKQLADFLGAIESYVADYGSPDDLPKIALRQISVSVQRLLRQYARTRYPDEPITFENMMSALVHTLVDEDPHEYFRKSTSQLNRFAYSPTLLHVHLCECYELYLDVCRHMRVRPIFTEGSLANILLPLLSRDIREFVEDRVATNWGQALNDIYFVGRLVQRAEASSRRCLE
ncbi:hypothetical protein Emed_001974 [Eimeria media]